MHRSSAELFSACPIVGIFRAREYGDPLGVVEQLVTAGVSAVEFTFTGRDAAEAVARVKRAFADLVVGAGTVRTSEQLEAARAAGADFVASPCLDPRLVEEARGLPMLPGVFTPTEVAQAVDLGCSLVKLYPASLGGPSYLRDLSVLFPTTSFAPSGGIGADDLADYLAAGALTVGIGSWLVGSPAAPLAAGEIRRRASELVARAGEGATSGAA